MRHDDEALALIARIGVLRQPSDLDLLLFFARHPRTLLPSEQLSNFVGYGMKEMALSLDVLVEAGLVTRKQSKRHPARMFELAGARPDHGWFPDLVRLGRTRDGRQALLSALKRPDGSAATPGKRATRLAAASDRPRPMLVERKSG